MHHTQQYHVLSPVSTTVFESHPSHCCREHDPSQSFREHDTVIEWAAAAGATRYMYVHPIVLTEERIGETTRRPHRTIPYIPEEPYEAGEWIDESYQLHDGDYFGSRYHLRVYESPYEDDEWVAIQAHSEHWDWFRLRHTVDGIEGAQSRVESEFMGKHFVDDVWRMYLENNETADADGWATVIDVRPLPLRDAERVGSAAIALVLSRSVRRANPVTGWRKLGRGWTDPGGRSTESTTASNQAVPRLVERIGYQRLLLALRVFAYRLLFTSLFVLYLSVRVSGILLEQHAAMLSPKHITALVYPVIAIGLPCCAYVFARTIEPIRSFVLAAAGLGVAIVVDYSYLNIAVLPIDVVVHRLGIAIAIGLIAAGATSRWTYIRTVNRWFGAGVLLWVFFILAPLVGWM